MKVAFGFAIIFWLICGLIGAWRMGELDVDHWRAIARGPLTLIEALNEDPVSVPSLS